MNKERATQISWLLLRLVAGFIFFQAGGLKLFGWYGGMPPDGNTATFISQVWIGGFLEFAGGILVMLGLFTRPTAFILSGEMAVAYFQFHQPDGFWPIQNQGVSAVLYCFIFLYMSARGAGKWGLDDLIRGKLSH